MGLPKSVEILHLMVFTAFFTRLLPPTSHCRQLFVASKTLPCTLSPSNVPVSMMHGHFWSLCSLGGFQPEDS